MTCALTYFQGKTSPVGTRRMASWPQISAWLSKPVESPVKDIGGFSLATFRGDKRSKANVERVYAIGIDLDHLDALSVNTRMRRDLGLIVDRIDFERLIELFDESDAFVHTTWSSTEDAPRARVFLLTDRAMSAAEYVPVYESVAARCESAGLMVDRQASDPSRFWFRPSHAPGRTFRFSVGSGRAIIVNDALEAFARRVAPPVPLPRMHPRSNGAIDLDRVVERAARWLAHRDPAIQGSGGDKHTFETVQCIVRGFDLDDSSAYRVLCDWNATCRPPWDEHGLRRKIREARENGRMVLGALRDARRSA